MIVSTRDYAVGAPTPGVRPAAMSRPQVGIERLPTRRLSNEPRESMNCKSCRKRKIKCNRLRPACEACQVFQCACVYDAIPKKRGPKTDVLEALLKRVDGLEQKLKDTKKSDAATQPAAAATSASAPPANTSTDKEALSSTASVSDPESAGQAESSYANPNSTARHPGKADQTAYSPAPSNDPSPSVQPEALLDTYFSRLHAKPFHILDESSVRQRLQLQQLPQYLSHAIFAVAARYTPHPNGYQSAVKLSEDLAARARSEMDTDEPSVDALQALLLLVTAFTAAGKGKKAYMLMTSAIGMCMALELHRELPPYEMVTPAEREGRRRLFWSCYLLDRFMACGSKRSCLLADKAILLRLPSWQPGGGSHFVEGSFFSSGSNVQLHQAGGAGPVPGVGDGPQRSQGSSGMLIDISRILGVTNRYLAAGGVKGDSHFPWHSLSNLSRIRHDLDVWASGAEEVFSSLDTLFGQPDSAVLVLSKLVYHLIHCLIYRPFLPVDLAELAGAGQDQSWQIEATNMCFLHANAIAELVELGKQAARVEWPAFVGYCICTAGTVHVHGAHYRHCDGEGSVFGSSAEFLSREMQQLSELRYAWASVQHHRETLQGIFSAHAELVRSVSSASDALRHSPAFQLEDFFDRYANIGGPGGRSFRFDAANVSLSDVVVDFTADAYTGHDLYAPRVDKSGRDGGGKMTSPMEDFPGHFREAHAASLDGDADVATAVLNPMGSLASPNAPRQELPGPGQRPQRQYGSYHDHIAEGRGPIGAGGGPSRALPGASANSALGLGAHGGKGSNMQVLPGLASGPFGMQYMPDGQMIAGEVQQSGAQLSGNGPSLGGGTVYDPMFGEQLPTNAFASPAPWQGDDGGAHAESASAGGGGGVGAALSPSGRPGDSRMGPASAGGDEKDPFLSLLEQLAENDLDLFLGGTASGS